MVEWASREHRKQAGRLDAGRGSTWWAPTAVGWWIGVLFTIGSACFAVGAVPGYVDWVGTDADAITFFVGSLFFTSAASLQYLADAQRDRTRCDRATDERLRFWTWEPGRIDWSASAVQLVGTVFFNVSTFAAIDASLDATQAHRLVWVPDMLGSICFLVASGLAWFEVGHGWWSWRPPQHLVAHRRAQPRRIDRVRRVGGRVEDRARPPASRATSCSSTSGPSLGGLCFLVGALLLLPERTATRRHRLDSISTPH